MCRPDTNSVLDITQNYYLVTNLDRKYAARKFKKLIYSYYLLWHYVIFFTNLYIDYNTIFYIAIILEIIYITIIYMTNYIA